MTVQKLWMILRAKLYTVRRQIPDMHGTSIGPGLMSCNVLF